MTSRSAPGRPSTNPGTSHANCRPVPDDEAIATATGRSGLSALTVRPLPPADGAATIRFAGPTLGRLEGGREGVDSGEITAGANGEAEALGGGDEANGTWPGTDGCGGTLGAAVGYADTTGTSGVLTGGSPRMGSADGDVVLIGTGDMVRTMSDAVGCGG